MDLSRREVDQDRLVPGIYLHYRSGLVNIWYMKVDSGEEEYQLTPDMMDVIVWTMQDYLKERYGGYRVLGVFQLGCRTGFYIVTRFISNHMIFGAMIDYIMELQCTISAGIPNKELSRAKDYMLSYYDNYLRYQSSAMKYNKVGG